METTEDLKNIVFDSCFDGLVWLIHEKNKISKQRHKDKSNTIF